MDPRATGAGPLDESALEATIRNSTDNYIADVQAKMKAINTDDLVDL